MKTIVISKKKLVIIVIVIAVLIFLGAVVLSSLSSARNKMGFGSSSETAIQAPNIATDDYSATTMMESPPYYDGGQPNITDTREFLKTNYSSTIKTRNVADMTRDVKNAIAGADGRIDNFYSSEKSSRISFVVAKSKFEAFRSEIESLTYAKLYTESVSSQNLLSQKQQIEEQTSNVLSSLANLQKQKEDLGLRHTQSVGVINREIARIQAELVDVRLNISNETDASVIALLRNQESSLLGQETVQRQKLNTENSNYSAQSKNLQNLIANENNNLTNVGKRDTQFTDNIETVTGSISINWVSLWQLAKIYSPISPIIVIIILVIIAWILLRRQGYLPKIILQ